MIRLWKIKRETWRILIQAKNVPGFLAEYFFSTPYYDLILSKQERQFDGELPFTGKVAIYLIFPDSGLLASHIMALEAIGQNGYSALVVSNLPLSVEVRDQLQKLSWRFIERPNYGYDFGGYRDGVLSLEAALPSMDRLVLLNDSTWFPLPGRQNWFEQAEKLDVDFAAAASNYGAKRIDMDEYQKQDWQYSSTHKNFHNCSFALMFSPVVLQNPVFINYWKNLRLSKNKKRTVRRGEIGLTQTLLRSGHSHRETCAIDHLDSVLASLSLARLVAVLQRVIIPENPRLKKYKHALLDAQAMQRPEWRTDAERFILTAVASQGVSYVLPELTTKEFGFPFLKKSPVWLDEEASDITLEIAREFVGKSGEIIVEEINNLRSRRLKRNRTAQAN